MIEDIEIPDFMKIPNDGFEPYEIMIKIRTIGYLKLYSPRLSLKMPAWYEKFIYPEWKSHKNEKGWSIKGHDQPPYEKHNVYYYLLEDFEPNTAYIHPIVLLIGDKAKDRRYGLYISVGAYMLKRCDPKDWLWTGWVKFYIRLKR